MALTIFPAELRFVWPVCRPQSRLHPESGVPGFYSGVARRSGTAAFLPRVTFFAIAARRVLRYGYPRFMPDKTSFRYGLAPRKIADVARELQLDTERILPHGHYIAKIHISELEARRHQSDGQLILVTAMTPTPQGEGKTTTTIGLADALRRLGRTRLFSETHSWHSGG